jgi:hypothetical protein
MFLVSFNSTERLATALGLLRVLVRLDGIIHMSSADHRKWYESPMSWFSMLHIYDDLLQCQAP